MSVGSEVVVNPLLGQAWVQALQGMPVGSGVVEGSMGKVYCEELMDSLSLWELDHLGMKELGQKEQCIVVYPSNRRPYHHQEVDLQHRMWSGTDITCRTINANVTMHQIGCMMLARFD